MKNILFITGIILTLIVMMGAVSPGFCGTDNPTTVVTAQEHGSEAPAAASGTPASGADNRAKLLIISAFAAAFAIAFAALGTGIGQGNAVKGAMEAIGRNPEAQNKIFPALILGLAFIESLALYALLVSLALLFFNPLLPKL
ncbi:MAG: ATP synthase F0 subunit C [Firmicutes bacterium]|nr:ATP synthase F0 subunit C [Bacillota bacterium]